MRAEGGSARRLTTEPFENNIPSWSRDGKWIYFSSDRTGTWQIWKVPAGGGNAVQVTRQGGFAAAESTDGRYLYYAKYYGVPGIWKLPVGGGEEVRVLERGHADLWAVTSQGICLLNLELTPAAIEFFDFATRHLKRISREALGPVASEPGNFAVSPDGKWVLYNRVDQMDSDIVLVENFH